MVSGYIRLGRNTAGHAAWLTAHGYKVTEEPGRICVEGEKFINEIDLSGDAEAQTKALKAVIEARDLFTYSTKAKTAKGDRSSIMLCGYLGPVSALMVKPVSAVKSQSAGIFAGI